MYAGYQLRRRYSHHHRHHFWTIIIVVLIVATVSSIAALFLRGFRIKDYTEQLNSKNLVTPEYQVWLLERCNYADKMDAYQAGIAAASDGLGVYIKPENQKWIWVAGVYLSESDAMSALNKIGHNGEMQVKSYSIESKKLQINVEAIQPCQQIFTAIQSIFNLLIDLRESLAKSTDVKTLQLELIQAYNQVKSSADNLQTINANLRSQILATIIYTANQNLLGLQPIISLNSDEIPEAASINTALLKTIFSLDNF